MKACPSGWHLPSNEEWNKLYHHAEGTSGTESTYISEIAEKYLKTKKGWDDYEGKSGNGADIYGFSASSSQASENRCIATNKKFTKRNCFFKYFAP
jgi:uncharacterized protein (TIGR02145 family)